MPAPANKNRSLARWRYVVPNAITSASLLLGLHATVSAIAGEIVESAWSIILCALLDKLDGTSARLLRATSRFGVEMDSFADFVAFGIAPATLVYTQAIASVGGSWADGAGSMALRLCAGIFILCAALRLARFNASADDAPKPGAGQYFLGFPSTLAGGLIALIVLVAQSQGLPELSKHLPTISLVLGATMLGSFRFPKIGAQRSHFLNAIQAAVLATTYLAGLMRAWPEYLLAVTGLYTLGGLVWGLTRKPPTTA